MDGLNSWLGLNLTNEHQWSVLPLDTDLYDGISGVILFLAYLGAITQENRYTTLAEAGLKSLQNNLKKGQAHTKLIGGLNGLGGLIYTLTHWGVLWDKADLMSEAEEFVQLLPPLIAEDEKFDIIAGAAGCIGSLISMYRCKPSESTLAAAVQCGDRLINQAQLMKQGVGWTIQGMATCLIIFVMKWNRIIPHSKSKVIYFTDIIRYIASFKLFLSAPLHCLYRNSSAGLRCPLCTSYLPCGKTSGLGGLKSPSCKSYHAKSFV